MEHNRVGWFEIYVQDMSRAMKFYETVFRVKLEKLNSPDLEMWAFPQNMERSGSAGALVKMPGFPSGGNSVLIYFNCVDCAVEADRVVKAGGRIQKERFSIGQYGFIALVFLIIPETQPGDSPLPPGEGAPQGRMRGRLRVTPRRFAMTGRARVIGPSSGASRHLLPEGEGQN